MEKSAVGSTRGPEGRSDAPGDASWRVESDDDLEEGSSPATPASGHDVRPAEGADASTFDERTAIAGRVMLRSTPEIVPGTVLAERYQIEITLGEGGSGTVYRAWDRILGEPIAMKILHPQRAREKSWIKRLAREVKVARAIGHPNVCRVFELGHVDGHWFVTMELAVSGSLRDTLRATASAGAGAQRPLGDRLRDIREVCAGLGAMHAVAIVHRDVTPQNVLRMADGRLVLTDFGLAIERDDQTTVHGGTPAYMPPEAARGERSNQRSDVFQLGMIMHEVLTGIRPTWTSDGSRLKLVEPVTGASPVEEELSRLIADCVDPDPARRPASAVAVAGRLAAAEVARPAPAVLRAFNRTGRFARRHRRLLMGAAAALVLVGVVRTVQVLSRPPLCRGAAQQLAGVWDPPRAEAVRRAFTASGKSYAAETFARVRSILDDYAAAWSRMYTDACEATHLRGEQSEEVLDLRMGCLKEHQGELRALTDLFSAADGEMVSKSINASSSLPSVSRCADIPVLRAVVRPPQDPSTRAKVDSLRERVGEVKALEAAGRVAEAGRKAKRVVEEARSLGYEPLLAEALEALGRVERWTNFPEAEAALDEAMLAAEASRHDRLLAEAAVDKVGILVRLNRRDDLKHLALRAEGTLRRIGGDPLLQSWIYNEVGSSLMQEGRHVESLAMYRKSMETKLTVLPADHWDVAASRGNIAQELHQLGRNREALEENQRALEMLERHLGREHPELALHVYNRGEIRLALGQVPGAREDFERSLSIWSKELPPDHLFLSYPLTGFGLAALAEGKGISGTIPSLERALAIREHAAASPEARAETMFALARALWQAGPDSSRDRKRALGLAEGAKNLLPKGESAERRQIDESLIAWQGGNHRAPPTLRFARTHERSLRP